MSTNHIGAIGLGAIGQPSRARTSRELPPSSEPPRAEAPSSPCAPARNNSAGPYGLCIAYHPEFHYLIRILMSIAPS